VEPVNIHIGSGLGTGPTKLAAFDSALNDAGIANYNLLILSSVIPPNSNIIEHDGAATDKLPGAWGDRLYLVQAEMRIDTPGIEAWAGIGWVQDAETGRGLFVEHEGLSEAAVRGDIEKSLKALMATRNVDFGAIHMKVAGQTCTDLPVCAMVVAAYQVSDWDNAAHHFGA
jgi:arginine decarboxylase